MNMRTGNEVIGSPGQSLATWLLMDFVRSQRGVIRVTIDGSRLLLQDLASRAHVPFPDEITPEILRSVPLAETFSWIGRISPITTTLVPARTFEFARIFSGDFGPRYIRVIRVERSTIECDIFLKYYRTRCGWLIGSYLNRARGLFRAISKWRSAPISLRGRTLKEVPCG